MPLGWGMFAYSQVNMHLLSISVSLGLITFSFSATVSAHQFHDPPKIRSQHWWVPTHSLGNACLHRIHGSVFFYTLNFYTPVQLQIYQLTTQTNKKESVTRWKLKGKENRPFLEPDDLASAMNVIPVECQLVSLRIVYTSLEGSLSL